jgi:hypothetical protein
LQYEDGPGKETTTPAAAAVAVAATTTTVTTKPKLPLSLARSALSERLSSHERIQRSHILIVDCFWLAFYRLLSSSYLTVVAVADFLG